MFQNKHGLSRLTAWILQILMYTNITRDINTCQKFKASKKKRKESSVKTTDLHGILTPKARADVAVTICE